jgi:ribosomal protein L37E
MAICIRCGRETQLYNNGIPVCLSCVDTQSPQTRQPTWDAAQFPNDTQSELSGD